MPRFSILISVYNGEKYLKECLDSCLSQTFSDFEVVAVNDGSTDGSAAILTEYSEKDGRIRVFHNQNCGVFLTRKFAEEHCNGDFVLHADCDDLLEPELLSELDTAFKNHGCDMVFFDMLSFFPNGNTVLKTYFDFDRLFLSDEKHELLDLLFTTTFNSLCHKCFNRKLISSCPDYDFFKGLSHGEDLLRSAYLLCGADSFYYLKKPLYRYRRDVGASARFSKSIILDSDKVTSHLKKLINVNDELFSVMCRKQFNNFFRLLYASEIHFSQKVEVLKFVRTLDIFKNASSAVGDSTLSQLRFRLTEKGFCAVSLLLQKLSDII